MNEPLKIELTTPIPSKKNSRVVMRGGFNIPSKAYRKWYKENISNLKCIALQHGTFTEPVSVKLEIVLGNKLKRDIDNALTSALDIIKDAGIIKDDCWEYVPSVSCDVIGLGEYKAYVKISKKNIDIS